MRISNARACVVGLTAIAASWVVGDRARRVIEQTSSAIDVAERPRRIDRQLIAELRKNLDDLRQSYADTRRALRDKELILAMMEDPGVNNPRPGPSIPRIEAKVADVSLDPPTPSVVLAALSGALPRQGYEFSVYRGSEFVGKVIVEKVEPHSCVARVLFTKVGMTIEPGDVAATRLD
jgi:hypothetical protein